MSARFTSGIAVTERPFSAPRFPDLPSGKEYREEPIAVLGRVARRATLLPMIGRALLHRSSRSPRAQSLTSWFRGLALRPSGLATLFLFAVLALSSVGCVSQPTVEIYGARLSGLGPQGVNLNMQFKVRNANSFDVYVRDMRADVVIAERYRLPTVEASPNAWLPADGTTVVTVPVVIPWGMIAPLLATTIGSNTITYRARGAANVVATRALKINLEDYTFDQDGKFFRSELVAAAGRGILP